MAAGRLFIPGWMPARDSDGDPIPNVSASFYQNETDVLAVVYADEALTTPLTNPVKANSSGRFPQIYADDSQLFSVSVEAPYGPPGQPFTFDGLSASQAADIAAANMAQGAADDVDAAIQAAIEAGGVAGPAGALAGQQAAQAVVATKADVTGGNVNPATFRSAINAVSKSGDEITGLLGLQSVRSGTQFGTFPFPNVVTATRSIFWGPAGGYGLVGASTDAGSANRGGMSNVGIGGFCQVGNAANPQTGYAGYFETRATAAAVAAQVAAGVGGSHGIEIAIVNYGTQVSTNPSSPNSPGLTEGLRISCGREDDTTDTNASHYVALVNANKTCDKGIVFGESALSGNMEALSMSLAHKQVWYSGATPIAYDRADTVQRRSISTSDPATVDMIRSRPSGAAVASGDILGRFRSFYNDGPSDVIGGKLEWVRGASNAVMARLTAKNSGNAEIGLTIVTNGLNSIDPTLANTFGLGQVNAFANIYSQNALTVTSDGRTKVDLGPLDDRLLRVGKALVIKAYQDREAVERKGADGARIHFGLIAQEVVAAFEAEGLDPFRYGAVCADPWMEEVEVSYEAEEPVMETYEAEEVTVEIGADGGAVAVRRPVTRERELWNALPLFDADGNPVWARDPQPKSALVVDDDGDRQVEIEGEKVNASLVPFKPGMRTGSNGVLRIFAEVKGSQQTYRIPATRPVTLTRTELRQRVDENGEPMMKLQLRYEPLALLMITALRSNGAQDA